MKAMKLMKEHGTERRPDFQRRAAGLPRRRAVDIPFVHAVRGLPFMPFMLFMVNNPG